MRNLYVFLIAIWVSLSACASQASAVQVSSTTQAVTQTATTSSVDNTADVSSPPSAGSSQGINAVMQAPPGGQSNSSYTITAAYAQDGGSETRNGATYTAFNQDQSAVYVKNAGKLTLSNATITTNGNTSSQDNSSFHGLNAAVLAAGGSAIRLADSTITTTGTGANGAFATDAGSSATLSKVTINAMGDGGHGVMATNKAKTANLTLDASSTWNVTPDSYLTSLTDTGGISGTTIANITGNGHTVYYDKSACPGLGSQTYTLSGGGYLKPAN